MTTARAAVLQEFGSPVRLREFESPAVGRADAIVEVAYAGICGTDIHLQAGNLKVPVPVVLGHEAVGRIAELGPDLRVDALGQPLGQGDLVGWASSISCGECFYCVEDNEPTLCERRRIYGINQSADEWPHLSGGWADRIYLREGTTIVRIPDGVSAEAAIALGCAGPTVQHGLDSAAGARLPGGTVVVQGAGPVGLAACMYAKLRGAAKVVLVGAPAGRLELAQRLGVCDETIDIEELGVPERAAKVVAGTPSARGADLVIEATGVPSAVTESLSFVRRNGALLVLGQYTDRGDAAWNPHVLTFKQATMIGSWAFSARHYVDYVRSLPALNERFDLSAVTTSYDLASVVEAMADMRAGTVIKPILRCGMAEPAPES